MALREYVTRIPRPASLAINLPLAAFLGITDYLTGPQLSFSIFYLIPVSLTTLRLKRLDASLVALASAITWLWADLASGDQYSHGMIPYWNASVRLGYFLLHATLLDILLHKPDLQKDLARRDPLTGAANWRYFQEHAFRELARSRRPRRPLTAAYLDLDDFKTVNDTLGHEAGDDLLRTIVELMQANVRPTDLVARTGGDEFVLLFSETGYIGGARC
jgi:GGDEF domain-containing protein